MKQQGICPKCNSANIDYDVIEVVDNMVYYPCTCEECGYTYKEWYSLKFEEITE